MYYKAMDYELFIQGRNKFQWWETVSRITLFSHVMMFDLFLIKDSLSILINLSITF